MDGILRLNNGDFFSKLLTRLRLTPIAAAFAMAIINLVTSIPLAIILGAWSRSAKSNGLIGEPSAWFNDYLVEPILIGYFLWVPRAFGNLAKLLIEDDIFRDSVHVHKVLRRCLRWLQTPWTARIAFGVALLFCVWFVSLESSPTYPSWVFVNQTILFVRLPSLFISVYACILLTYNWLPDTKLLTEKHNDSR